MNKEEKRITIKDIALQAGVSKGTVDRVLHNRGEVSEISKQKVLQVAKQIGYKPNVYASLLASQKKYFLACLIPSYNTGEYWEQVAIGLTAAKKKAEPYHISIQIFTFNLFSAESLQQTFNFLMEQHPDAVVMAPTHPEKSRQLIKILNKKQIPCLLIDSYLSNCKYFAYFGMPMLKSGYLAAHLLVNQEHNPTIGIFQIHKREKNANNSADKRLEGFVQYLKEYQYKSQLIHEYIHPYDSLYNQQVFDHFFQTHPHIHHLITFNSRVHLIAEYLQKHPDLKVTLIGFDHLPQNIEGLKNRSIQFLITQHTENLLSYCVETIINYFIYKKTPDRQNFFIAMDILTPFNADYYQNSFSR